MSTSYSSTLLIYLDVSVSKCPPPNLKNGKATVSSTSIGNTAELVCLGGFTLVGSSERTCLNNGKWTGSEPACQSKYIKISCLLQEILYLHNSAPLKKIHNYIGIYISTTDKIPL